MSGSVYLLRPQGRATKRSDAVTVCCFRSAHPWVGEVLVDLAPGELPDVEILDELGRGAQTVVYRVRRRGVEYALKLMRQRIGADERDLVAFRREAALLACVDHPRMPRIYDVGQVRGRPYLMMDVVDGRPLDELLRAGPLRYERVAELGVDVAGALAAAHRAGLVHRDVKPHNIVVLPGGEAQMIDFGLAIRAVDDDGGPVAGTLAYSAPEQSGMLRRPVDAR